jgi:ABC-type Fe3+-siderophore transport system permease subunit
MLRNNLPIARIFGIAFIGISVFFFSVLLIELTREPYYSGEVKKFGEEEIIMTFCAVSSFSVGLGMFFKLKWARFLATLAIFAIGAFCVYMLSSEIGDNYKNTVMSISGIVCCVSLALSFGLLMYNKKLSDEFKDTPQEDEYDDAIDSVLM